jgi:sulfur-oxidizing protein SoxY
MRLRGFENAEAESAGLVDAQLMIRHPNNSGLQRDLITNYYIPAYFVRELEMTVAGDLLLRMEGGISISENPTFRLIFQAAGDEPIAVRAVDTKDDVFEQIFPGPLGSES